MKRNTRLFTLVLSALLLFGGCRSTDGGGENKIPEIPVGIITADDLPDNTGAEDALAQVLEAANRRTLVVAACADGVAFYGMAVNGKAGKVERKVDADDVALTIATIANLPISADCTAGIIYQVLKDPNLKLTEITKLEEALARMEQVMARNSREPWEKHDCA